MAQRGEEAGPVFPMANDATNFSAGEPSDSVKATAQKCFDHARKVGEAKNYDYAIELYMQGLALWTSAVEEGLKMLRVVGVARRQAGKSAPGFLTVRKFPLGGKDALKNLLAAYQLFALDPLNSQYQEAILVNAAKLGLARVGLWIAPILWESFSREGKMAGARCEVIFIALNEVGDRLQAAADYKAAAEVFKVSQYFADVWKQAQPDRPEAHRAVSAASSKLTIVVGRFDTDEDFRSSLKNGEAQRDQHDRQRSVQQEDRLRELIDKARADYRANPNTPLKLLALVDLLTRQEIESEEDEAIALLSEASQRIQDYALKFKADDIRVRRLRRREREAIDKHRAAPQDAALKHDAERVRRSRVEEELKVIEDRIAHYPTDMRLRYELGVRLFEMGRIDDAIPVFQQAQSEPKRRDHARLYIGRCFYEKKFYAQAENVFRQTLGEHELKNDEVGKELQYWLARALDAAGKSAEAGGVYGQLIQIDYNYRDARLRFEKLNDGGAG